MYLKTCCSFIFFIMFFPLKKILSCKSQWAGILLREIISQESLPLDVSDHLKAYRNPGLQSLSLKASGALSVVEMSVSKCFSLCFFSCLPPPFSYSGLDICSFTFLKPSDSGIPSVNVQVCFFLWNFDLVLIIRLG